MMTVAKIILYDLFQELRSIGVKPEGLVRRLAKAAKKVNDSPIKSEIPVSHVTMCKI